MPDARSVNATRVDRSLTLPVGRRWYLASALVLGFGLYAVGPGDLYTGSTWPDYLVIGGAALLSVTGFVAWAVRAADGGWSWVLLRNRATVGCVTALAAALVATWLRPPRDSSVFAVADSFLGYLQLLVAGLLCVAAAGAVFSMMSLSPNEGASVDQAAVVRRYGVDRILLRHYRVFPREPAVDVDEAGLTIRVPAIFGPARPWRIPMAVVGVFDPELADDDEDWSETDAEEQTDEPPGPDWMTADEFVVPFLPTTSVMASPNLLLLFTVPQRIPPLRWAVMGQLGLSVRASRRDPGVRVDGVQLRAVDPVAAVQTLLAHGAGRIPDPDEFIQQHRQIVVDPAHVAREFALQRRVSRWSAPLGVIAFLCFPAWLFWHDDRLVVVAVLASAVAALLPRWLRRRGFADSGDKPVR